MAFGSFAFLAIVFVGAGVAAAAFACSTGAAASAFVAFLVLSLLGRAQTFDDRKQHAEAIKNWDKALELSPEAEQPRARMKRAVSRVRAGQVDTALKEAEELSKIQNAAILYNAACVFALAADRRDEPGGSLSKEDCAKRAVALLQQAVAKGYKDVEHLKKDDDLKALREREDFKQLVAELEAAKARMQ